LTEIALNGNEEQQVDQTPTSYRNLDEGQIVDISHLFSYIAELKQKAHDIYNELSSHCRAITTEAELRNVRDTERTLAVQEGRLKSDLRRLLKETRASTSDDSSLEQFCNGQYEEANGTFERCEEIYNREKQQIVFAKRCRKFGAGYLEPPIAERIAGACDRYESVYVLFDGNADGEEDDDGKAGSSVDGGKKIDCETIERNHATFIELAKGSQRGKRNAFYVAWPDRTALRTNGGVRIERYSRGKLTQKDVARDLAEMREENLAHCATARWPYCLVPFRVRCPGSIDGDCSRERRPWTCINCKQALQFSLLERTLCCLCGQAKPNQFQFRCSSDAHGSRFIRFKVRFPGSLDEVSSGDKRPLTCISCEKTLPFGAVDGALYPSCGKTDVELCRYQLAVDNDSRSVFVGTDDGVDVLLSPTLKYVDTFHKQLSRLETAFRSSVSSSPCRSERRRYCRYSVIDV